MLFLISEKTPGNLSNNSATTALKGGDKTPSGVELSNHAAGQANRREFTLKNIDDIILNNKKTRKKEFHPNGEIRWRYQDKRGNTVITNEDGTRVITVYSHPASANNEKYIPVLEGDTLKNLKW